MIIAALLYLIAVGVDVYGIICRYRAYGALYPSVPQTEIVINTLGLRVYVREGVLVLLRGLIIAMIIIYMPKSIVLQILLLSYIFCTHQSISYLKKIKSILAESNKS